MNILAVLTELLSDIAPVETGVFSDEAPAEYIVITPLTDTFELFGDNRPGVETQEARLSLFSQTNYISLQHRIVAALFAMDFTITEHRYIGREDDSGYFHYVIDVSKYYLTEGLL